MSYNKKDNNNTENSLDNFNFKEFENLSDAEKIIKKSKPKKSIGFKLASVFLSILLVISILGVGITLFAYVILNQMNIVKSDSDYTIQEEDSLIPEEDDNSIKLDAPKTDIALLESKIESNIDSKTWQAMASDDVYNILLIGSDTRSKGERGRSDTMIILSINKKSKKIFFTSVLRDSYVAIPDRLNNRINAAYSFGGAEMLMDTIELNFKIHLEKYMSVDFSNFISIIDTLGGVELPLSEEEIQTVNNMSVQYCTEKGISGDFSSLTTSPGNKKLNGIQALMYSRIRKSDSDFARTGRQRLVLQQLMDKARSKKLTELYTLSNEIMPLITTNVSDDELMYLVLQSQSLLKYSVIEQQVPIEETYEAKTIRGMSVIGITDFDKNVRLLQDTVFEQTKPIYVSAQNKESSTTVSSGFSIGKNIFFILFGVFGAVIVTSVILIVIIDKSAKRRNRKHKRILQ